VAGEAVMRRAWLALALLLAAPPLPAQAPVVKLHGLAFDSVTMRPLPHAFLVLDGARNARADSAGIFSFDSVALGVHEIEMQHADLDSMGLAGIASTVALLDASTIVTVAVPSFATLWRAGCGESPAPADSGFVYGAVRDARTGTEVAGATVVLTWIDLTLINTRQFQQKRYRAEVETDEGGQYSLCGVPLDAGLQIEASHEEAASAPTAIGGVSRVRRRDLLIGPTDTASAPRGTVVGIVTHRDGRPFDGATVILDDAQPQRTGADGRFGFTGVLTGTRQLEVLAIGARPQTVAVDVIAGQQVSTLVPMERLTTLDVVRVIGTRYQMRALEELADRMAKGQGQFRDSTHFHKGFILGTAFSGLRGLRLTYERGGRISGLVMLGLVSSECGASLFVDGYRSDMEWLNTMAVEDIAVMEVYDRPELVPFRFANSQGQFCGVVVIWTKRMMP
jgi:hypothetical protein